MSARAATPSLVRAMSAPAFYPDHPERVELRETHTAWVWLAGDYAYKVKKPVTLPFIDCATPAQRHELCEREVTLNRRLAPDVYLGVVPVIADHGRLRLDGALPVGAAEVDYAVKMKRLPDDRRLGHLIESGAATLDDIQAIAARLVSFHSRAATSQAWRFGSAERVRQLVMGNLDEARELAADTLTRDRLTVIGDFSRRYIASNWTMLNQRASTGRVCDGHGDLRGDAIYLLNGAVVIIDALEFSERLRYGDVASELAFLAMDLDRLGRPDYAQKLVLTYAEGAADDGLEALLPLYKTYRATVRAKVELIRSLQQDCAVEERVLARERARRYLELGCGYGRTAEAPGLVIVCGLSGAGKSTLARALRDRTGFAVLASDAERKRIAGLAPGAHATSSYGHGIYAEDLSARVYASLVATAGEWLRHGQGVILDATFRHRAQRDLAIALARRHGLAPLFVECRAGQDEVIRRLIERSTRVGGSLDATVEIYLAQLRDFEPLMELPESWRIVADTRRPHALIVAEVERRLASPRRTAANLPR